MKTLLGFAALCSKELDGFVKALVVRKPGIVWQKKREQKTNLQFIMWRRYLRAFSEVTSHDGPHQGPLTFLILCFQDEIADGPPKPWYIFHVLVLWSAGTYSTLCCYLLLPQPYVMSAPNITNGAKADLFYLLL